MSTIHINEVTIHLKSFAGSTIEIANEAFTNILYEPALQLKKPDLLIVGCNIKSKDFDRITPDQLFSIKIKFRVNYEQAVIYKIIEKINFYTYIIIFTEGFDNNGIEFLNKIVSFFEFADKRILVVKRQYQPNNFEAVHKCC